MYVYMYVCMANLGVYKYVDTGCKVMILAKSSHMKNMFDLLHMFNIHKIYIICIYMVSLCFICLTHIS